MGSGSTVGSPTVIGRANGIAMSAWRFGIAKGRGVKQWDRGGKHESGMLPRQCMDGRSGNSMVAAKTNVKCLPRQGVGVNNGNGVHGAVGTVKCGSEMVTVGSVMAGRRKSPSISLAE